MSPVEVLIPEDQLRSRVNEIGHQIEGDYEGKDLILVGILKGAAMFMMDLIRVVQLPLAIDFMAVSSYGAATESSGVVRILKDLETAITGRHVLLVEDIVDSGLTIAYVLDMLRRRGPASLKVAALLVKERAADAGLRMDYVGFTIGDEFVVGYGLDLDERYRNLPYVGLVKS
ncbi:MAG: hypoxanthine phosphoribosyltransferase [Chloroflexi bacterium]|nr:hypoxanthine phosphoribosyltransferase [Chloroflexota bacterium]